MKTLYFNLGTERIEVTNFETGKKGIIDPIKAVFAKNYSIDVVGDFYSLDETLRENKYDKFIMNIYRITDSDDVELAEQFFKEADITLEDCLGSGFEYGIAYLKKVIIPENLIDLQRVLIKSPMGRGEFQKICPELVEKNMHYLCINNWYENYIKSLKKFLNSRDGNYIDEDAGRTSKFLW